MAVASGGKATVIEVPVSLRRVVSDRIRWQAAESSAPREPLEMAGVLANA